MSKIIFFRNSYFCNSRAAVFKSASSSSPLEPSISPRSVPGRGIGRPLHLVAAYAAISLASVTASRTSSNHSSQSPEMLAAKAKGICERRRKYKMRCKMAKDIMAIELDGRKFRLVVNASFSSSGDAGLRVKSAQSPRFNRQVDGKALRSPLHLFSPCRALA